MTNVVRHSQARCCTIRLPQKSHEVQIEILNNGPSKAKTTTSAPENTAASAADTRSSGNGLRGLSELIEMPGDSGLDAAADLRARLPACRVLILTTLDRQ